MPENTLSSEWGLLNPNLLARFQAIDYDEQPIPGEATVVAPLLEGATMAMQFNWQSPFENMGPESKAPALTALIQSGALVPLSQRASQALGDQGQRLLEQSLADFVRSTERGIADSRGLTGMTKLNSTQVFNGMPPVKISLSAYFRAWRDPYTEVELPLQQLKEWAVPKELAPAGFLLGGTLDGSERSFLRQLLPSQSPTLIGFSYGKRSFPPMVIESIEEPLTSPKSQNGDYVECVLSMTLATLTALDRRDLARIFEQRAQRRT